MFTLSLALLAQRGAPPESLRDSAAELSSNVWLVAGILAGILLVTAGMTARRLIAPRAATPAKLTTYESGVDPVGVGWARADAEPRSWRVVRHAMTCLK
jgi:hypothetical protein